MLQWSTPVNASQAAQCITSEDRLLLTGSCFSSQIGSKLAQSGWHTTINPAGVMYNPLSIAAQINRWIQNKKPEPDELFLHQGLWRHADWHSSFAAATKEAALETLADSVSAGRNALQEANVLILTPGTARVYERAADGHLMANNHKLPSSDLNNRILSFREVKQCLEELFSELTIFRPDLQIILTLSPVRHIRDGLEMNAYSKAILLSAIREVLQHQTSASYFPSYEIMVDELRDYRFYEADLIHPNAVATDHIWNIFQQVALDTSGRQQVKEVEQYRSMAAHRILHPDAEESTRFREKLSAIKQALQARYPHLTFPEQE